MEFSVFSFVLFHCPCVLVRLTVTVLFWQQPYWKADKGPLVSVVGKPWSSPQSPEVASKLAILGEQTLSPDIHWFTSFYPFSIRPWDTWKQSNIGKQPGSRAVCRAHIYLSREAPQPWPVLKSLDSLSLEVSVSMKSSSLLHGLD